MKVISSSFKATISPWKSICLQAIGTMKVESFKVRVWLGNFDFDIGDKEV
jgi:hypothetical protein